MAAAASRVDWTSRNARMRTVPATTTITAAMTDGSRQRSEFQTRSVIQALLYSLYRTSAPPPLGAGPQSDEPTPCLHISRPSRCGGPGQPADCAPLAAFLVDVRH